MLAVCPRADLARKCCWLTRWKRRTGRRGVSPVPVPAPAPGRAVSRSCRAGRSAPA